MIFAKRKNHDPLAICADLWKILLCALTYFSGTVVYLMVSVAVHRFDVFAVLLWKANVP